jgi:hypothetical protein
MSQNALVSITQDDLVHIYGDRPALRKLTSKLGRCHEVADQIRLLREFDEVNWIETTLLTLGAEVAANSSPSNGGFDSRYSFPDVLQIGH